MPAARTTSPSLFRFLRGVVLQPREVAAVLPSSRALETRLSVLPCLRLAKTVVEFGPGTGGTTRALLRGMPSSAHLLCIEVLPEFVKCLKRIPDSRLIVKQGSAYQFEKHLRNSGVSEVDVIVSGIPFSLMTERCGRELVERIHRKLRPGGSFVAYQVRDAVIALAGECFGRPQMSRVVWNIPPVRVYQWTKSAAPGTHRHAIEPDGISEACATST